MSVIEYGDKWEKDRLKRKGDADYLSAYLTSKHEQAKSNLKNGSFVLNINAEWGFGKTYLLKNWADDLAQKNHPVVYFDAWKNDFSKEPLLAFISTINEQLSPYFDKKIDEKRGLTKVKHFLGAWFNSGKKLVSPSYPIVLGAVAKKLTGMSLDELSELIDEEVEENEVQESSGSKKDIENTVASVVSKAATKMMESHSSTKRTIKEFKVNLEKLTNHLDSLESIKLPMFIFIDELDRCRPSYAIEVLENIKHLFGVQGVFFIVATASEQLGHSIKAVYGQDFDSPNYLKRFFDQSYTIQDPDRYSFADYLFSQYSLTERENLFTPIGTTKPKPLVETFSLVSSLFNCGLRDMIQYCIVIDSVSLTYKNNSIHLVYLLFLIIIKDKNNKMYKLIVDKITPNLENLDLNNEVNVKGIETQSYTSRRNARISLISIIQRYLKLSKMTLPDISKYNTDTVLFDLINIELTKEMTNTFMEKNIPTHDLGLYPKLIDQAGRIS